MHYPDHPTADLTNPLKPQFTDGDAQLGEPATVVDADWLNDIGNNLMAAVTAAGIVPTKLREADLADAIARMAAGRDAARARLDRDVAGGQAEIVLTEAEAGPWLVHLTGARTDDLLLTWPDSYVGARWIYQGTTGGFAVTARTATQLAGTAIALPAGKWSLVVLDGTSLAVLFSSAGDGIGGGAANAIEQGLHTIWVPAAAMVPRDSYGALPGALSTAVEGRQYSYLIFDPATVQRAEFSIGMPASWDRGSLVAEFMWANSGGMGAAQWSIIACAIGDGDTLDVTAGAVGTVDDAGPAVEVLAISPPTAPFAVGGGPQVGDMVQFTVWRGADSAADTLAGYAGLIGVRIGYTINAATDA